MSRRVTPPQPAPVHPFSASLGSTQSIVAGFIHDRPRTNRIVNRTISPGAYVLMYILKGGGVYEDAQAGQRRVAAGDVIVCFPGLTHTCYPEPAWSEAYLRVQGPVFEYLEKEGLLSRKSPILSPGLTAPVLPMFKSIVQDFMNEPPFCTPLLVARVHLLMLHIVQAHQQEQQLSSGNGFIQRACAFLKKNIDREFSAEEVQRHFGIGYEHFRKRFAAEMGMSPTHYRISHRIQHAKLLLIENKLSLKEIAAQLGYCDVYFFVRQFKQITGSTPGEFRGVK
jgi:AraC-like DNA-binding protein